MPAVTMTPGPGQKAVRYVGDSMVFRLQVGAGMVAVFLRTTIGRAARLRDFQKHFHAQREARDLGQSIPINPIASDDCWRDVPMRMADGGFWEVTLGLAEVGFFEAKAFAMDGNGRRFWPDGPNFALSVQPDHSRTANTIYCAFTRQFGPTRDAKTTLDAAWVGQAAPLDQQGFAVIPPSGKFRDLLGQLPHIFGTLGCRILHLLPVNPTPATYARFGRFGSPYAVGDLTGIDPALVEFDQRTTGYDQFAELMRGVHQWRGRIFLDIVINHTGWGSPLQEQRPEWFLKSPNGRFASPGAWGTVWEDLVEIDHHRSVSWRALSDVFLVWCRRGVDGFRCDAGYKVPLDCWKLIVACVRSEFPDTVFLLEGLGGSWEATEALLQAGGMQWAYSELFQNYSGVQVSSYLDYALPFCSKAGVLVHYSETHDNERLAQFGREWSLLRNLLCGLTSVNGGFGFTNGVEWLATERVNVHSSRGLSWGQTPNIVSELGALNALLADHPCFFDGAVLRRVSPISAPVYALLRESAEGLDRVLVIINLDSVVPGVFEISPALQSELGGPLYDLLLPERAALLWPDVKFALKLELEGGGARCFSASLQPQGLSGNAYREARARAAWAWQAMQSVEEPERFGACNWREVEQAVNMDPAGFLSSVYPGVDGYPALVRWSALDVRSVTLVPPGHWVLVEHPEPFVASLAGVPAVPRPGVLSRRGYVAWFNAKAIPATGDVRLKIEVLKPGAEPFEGTLRLLPASLEPVASDAWRAALAGTPSQWPMVLLTNGRGGMARFCVDLGLIQSKYDALLAANLHATLPVDRHVMIKRMRAWINVNGFLTPLRAEHLVGFSPGECPLWKFRAPAGDGRNINLELQMNMPALRNAVRMVWQVTGAGPADQADLVIRFDIEDRNFHSETQRNPGAEHHFRANCRSLPHGVGFEFGPVPERTLRVLSTSGAYWPGEEWCQQISHPLEVSRGQVGAGDAYSPGWFDISMTNNRPITMLATAESDWIEPDGPKDLADPAAPPPSRWAGENPLVRALVAALPAYLVRRDRYQTVIAGYPWFLDWGRDTLIAARGLISAGLHSEVLQLLVTFGRFEDRGTLPNTIHGEDASNRDTVDAALWYALVCEELAAVQGDILYQQPLGNRGRSILDVLQSIAMHYQEGTPNGIRMDYASGLIWSPSHFTWMDTNYPAATPREGYAIEIQALWIRLLRQLYRVTGESGYAALAGRAEDSMEKAFWMADAGYYADCLATSHHGQFAPVSQSELDDTLRPNMLFVPALGLGTQAWGRDAVLAAWRYLLVPGGMRSLAPKPVRRPLAVVAQGGEPLNDPLNPYWGHYEGEEDKRRKPAYHNGTVWGWPLGVFCEALAASWPGDNLCRESAVSILTSVWPLFHEGALGHLPEILDGDAPHMPRGCDAQAWSTSEVLRVLLKLATPKTGNPGNFAPSSS